MDESFDYYESAEYNEAPMDVAGEANSAVNEPASFTSKSISNNSNAAKRFKIKAENDAAAANSAFGTGGEVFKSFFDEKEITGNDTEAQNGSSSQSQGSNSQGVPFKATRGAIDPRLYINKHEDGSTSMDFFFMDATENNGVVYLFGKVKVGDGQYVSCVTSVYGCERNLFVLPRAKAGGIQPGWHCRACRYVQCVFGDQ